MLPQFMCVKEEGISRKDIFISYYKEPRKYDYCTFEVIFISIRVKWLKVYRIVYLVKNMKNLEKYKRF